MKYLFYSILCFALLLIYSCGSNNKKPSIEADQELMELAKSKEEKKSDKLKALGGVDSLSLIAWGDTKFGMTKQEVKASKAFEEAIDAGYDDLLMHPQKSNDLRKLFHLSQMPHIYAYFKENELHLIVLESIELDATHIEDYANDCGIFAKEFMNKYGEPDYLKTTASILDFSNHQLKIASFSIGTKEIWIGLLEKDSQYKYYITIENKAFPKKKHIPTEEELKKQKEQDAKNKELRENSF